MPDGWLRPDRAWAITWELVVATPGVQLLGWGETPLYGVLRVIWPNAGEVARGRARRKPVVDDEMSMEDEPQQVTVVFRKPVVRPGTPEAQAEGCLCRFESNMAAGFLSAERGYEDEVIVVIHKDCPLHKIVRKPMEDVLGDQ